MNPRSPDLNARAVEENPEGMVAYAKKMADEFISRAEQLLDEVKFNKNFIKQLRSHLSEAKKEYFNGSSEGVELYDTAMSLHSYTRAQVKARQVINAVNPPPTSPEVL